MTQSANLGVVLTFNAKKGIFVIIFSLSIYILHLFRIKFYIIVIIIIYNCYITDTINYYYSIFIDIDRRDPGVDIRMIEARSRDRKGVKSSKSQEFLELRL